MMMLLIIFGVLLATVYADPVFKGQGQCKVGSWKEWARCTLNKNCQHFSKHVSYSVPINSDWDIGRAVMEQMMKDKATLWAKRNACRMSGECPQLFTRPSTGFFRCENRNAGDIPCRNVDQLSFLNFDDLGYDKPLPDDAGPAGNDIWGWVDPLNGDEYAIIGLTGGTSFVRITDPVNPVTVGFVYSATVASTWRDIKVIANYAYIVSEADDHGLQVFDMTRLRGRNAVGYFEPDAVSNEFGRAHNIVSNGETNFIYVVGCKYPDGYAIDSKGGLIVYDVSNPLKPRLAGIYAEDGYTHDAQCVVYHGPDTRYTGREICFNYNENTLTIVDVTDKSNMVMLSKRGYTGFAYTHQGWITEDHEIILLDDEKDELSPNPDFQFTKTHIWDVKNLSRPTLINTYVSNQRSVDHNQYIVGDLSYQANYEAGLRILHINRTTNTLTEVAHFDVFPISTKAEFNGAWSVFPYFPSGAVVVSSIDYGLFVVKPDMDAIRKEIESGNVPKSTMTRVREVISNVPGSICPPLVETKVCDAPIRC